MRHDLPGVGANLHDHVDVVQVLDAPQLKDLFGLSLAGAVNAIKGIFEWRRHRRGMLTTNFAEAGGFIRSRPEEERPDLQLHFVIGKLRRPWQEDRVRPRLLVPRLPAAAEEPRQRPPGERRPEARRR